MKPLQVVAGVVYNAAGEILLTSRPAGKAYAGYWEFAGGKVEAGESLFDALKREFAEELGITITRARPWLQKIHAYEHATVHLHFFRIAADAWHGTVSPREGQQLAWQQAGAYAVSPMLPANAALLNALAIPATFSGNPQHGFYSADNAYRIAPPSLFHSEHNALLLDAYAPQPTTVQPRAVWRSVGNFTEFTQAQDADALLWRVENDSAAQTLLHTLQQGVSLPIAAYARADMCARYAQAWHDAGLHALIENRELATA
ncbi:NUDIX domain-containing protein [Conchiformibius steedae]|uniref:NUDIX domain-containing protein n=1 Tax=Conchiformibius steedae TaxID=153493 RepID=UPI0026F0B6E9|nr:NUDIX domain-containing protein [Conchiformibius steedae]